MIREKQTLFVFLFIEQVPADNNASERAIRNVKVKQKISGQFKKNTNRSKLCANPFRNRYNY